MATNPPITVPIALSYRLAATLTLPWFIQRTEYGPEQATFRPLVNGEETFGVLYEALLKAKTSVDIICWGFQPSMYFKRGSQEASMPIGTLLAQLGARGVSVRLLCWQDDLHLAELDENEAPGNNLATLVKPYLPDKVAAWPVIADYVSKDYQADWERDFDFEWYWRANLNNVTATRSVRRRLDHYTLRSDAFKNVEFATRDFSLHERVEIDDRIRRHNEAVRRGLASGRVGRLAMAQEPTHHQKMVLVDYESPEDAVGFVMGHNMLDAYWDRDDHSCVRMHPRMGRNGPHPRQDMSSRITGPVLAHLNANFCQAWDEATGQHLGSSRADLARRLTLRRDGDTPVMAQVLRTQSQHGKRDIASLYLNAVNNATHFIYIENQYFRWPELAEKITQVVAAHTRGGRVPGENGFIHLFVVTNANDEAIGHGTVNTYAMLDALGRADTMPAIARAERDDALHAQLSAAQRELAQLNQSMARAMQGQAGYGQFPAALALQQDQQDAQAKVADLLRQIEANTKPIRPVEIPGLKVHICTLVAPDTPAGQPWEYVYVHAKLMIVDDVFMTLGSANINLRSMAVDSELNICHEHSGVTAPLRQRLWELHTNKLENGASDNPSDAFVAWGNIIDRNANLKIKDQSPIASLVKFMYISNKRTRLD
jgi:phosphatidylserine/phosphatidylglycerophosphate/cardiolipin synthase-like enzyme